MQVVINIPDEIYFASRQDFKFNSEQIEIIDKAIYYGTPLPKGHGRLIDADKLLKQPLDIANYPSNYVKIAPTIIEADKESKE